MLYIPILFLPGFGPGSLYYLLSFNGFILAVVPFPLSIGFAVQRSRLWDIDYIINRTLVYALLTVVLALRRIRRWRRQETLQETCKKR